MNAADMGWWKADLTTLNYECSEYISELLGLDDSGIISFEDFNKRILKEEQRPTTVHSFSEQQMSEVVYLLDTVKGAVWVRSKVCFQETDKEGHTNVYGIAELQEAPNMTQALQHSERILHNIYKHLPVGIELYNEDGILIDLNDKEQEMFHLEKKEDLLGLDIFKNPMFPEEMKERLRRNEDADFTFRYDFSKIGSYYKNSKREGTIDLVTKVTTLYDDEGNPINYLLINADKTETTIAYNKIQEFEEFFELVGDYAKVGYAHLNLLTGEGYAQKSWYRNIGEADGTPLYNEDGILIDLNDKEQEMFHLEKKEDLLGLDIFKNPMFPEEMKERLRRNEDADFTFRYDFSKIGSYYKNSKREGTIDLVTKVTTLYDDEGNPINYLLINADKTETTIAYNKIQEFEEFFELVGDYAKVGYAHLNLLTGEGYAQKSWYRNIGEADGTPLSDIIGIYRHLHPDDRNCMAQFFEDVRNGLTAKLSKEVRVLRSNGEYTWTHVNLLVRKYIPQDKIIELISINYDITELKKTEEMLVKARDKAEASDRLKSAFLANMSHEIRTPLNAIVGFSALLAATEDMAEKELYNSLISHNNELLLELINDVLDLSKLESGYLELHPSWFNLAELLDESVAEYTRQLAAGVELRTHYLDQGFLVELDRLRIKQILNNFLSNALKNTTSGYVEVFYEIDSSYVRIGVRDTGRGIPQNMLEKIFERFEKVDSFTQGAGLGLPICKSIVDKMNGRIWADSQLGIGTTFMVELPCSVTPIDA